MMVRHVNIIRYCHSLTCRNILLAPWYLSASHSSPPSMSLRLVLCITLVFQASSFSFCQGFVRSYATLGTSSGGNALVASPDGNLFLGGYQGDKALVMKIDPNGNILWSKTIEGDAGYINYVSQLSITPDGYLLGCGNSNSSGLPYNTFYFKMDLSGNLQWAKHSNTSVLGLYSKAILTAPDGSYSLIGGAYSLGPAADPVQRGISAATGSTTWTGPRYNYVPSNPFIDETYSAIPAANGGIFTTGRIYVDGGSPTMRPYISKFNNTGQMQWTKYYISDSISSARVYGLDIILNNDSIAFTYFGDILTYSNSYKIGIIRTDTIGTFAWGKNYQIQEYSTELSFKILPMPYGYIISGYGQGQNSKELFLVGIDNIGNVLWAKGYGDPGLDADLYSSASRNAITMNGDIYFTGRVVNNSSTDVLLYRVDQYGNMNCGPSHDLTIVTSDVPSYTNILTPSGSNDNATFSNVSSYPSTIIVNECNDPGNFLGNDTSICSSITLQAPSLGSGSTYLWQDGSSSASFTASSPGTYWAQVTSNCCSFIDSINILPGIGPHASFTASTQACSLTVNTTNSSTNANSFIWDFGDGFTGSSTQPSHTYANGGSYSLSLTATNGCGTDDTTIAVTVHLAQGSFAISGPDTLCPNVPGTFTGTLSNAPLSSILWSNGTQGPSISYSVSASTYLHATAIDSNTCSYTDSIYVVILNNPTAAFTFNALACDTEVTFVNQSTSTTDLLWNLGNGQLSSAEHPIGQYPLFGTYEITLIASNSCSSDTVIQNLTTGPTDEAVIAGPTTLCQGQSGIFNVSLAGGTGITSVAWSNGTSDSTSIALSFQGSSALTVSVTGLDGCIYQDTLLLSILPPPSASFTYVYNPCDSTAIFYNGTSNMDSIHWDFGNGSGSAMAIATTGYIPGTSYAISLVAYNACGTDTAQLILTTASLPELSVVRPAFICTNDPIELQVSISGGTLHNILWSTGDTSATIQITPGDLLTISVSAFTNDGCPLTAVDSIPRIGDGGSTSLYIPNAFTPNNDGINDEFRPNIATGYRSLEIFNRWGQTIFQSTIPNDAWLGTFKNQVVPDGTYVYIVKWYDNCEGTNKSRIGHVTLLR